MRSLFCRRLGTLDELFEILSWKQLGLHDKPILLADIDGYWAPLRGLLDDIVTKGFARPSHGRCFGWSRRSRH